MIFASIEDVQACLARANYVASRALATTVFLAIRMGRPLFLEGEAGVGKTEVAKVLAHALGRELIRLQCYDGLDAASAAYEWNFPRQMLEIRAAQVGSVVAHDIDASSGRDESMHPAADLNRAKAGLPASTSSVASATQHSARPEPARVSAADSLDLYDSRFLLKRPLLRALEPHAGGPPVLLIDELDRADEPFEAYLLEVLSDYQLSIPELGVIRAEQPPIVVITSNRTREIHDAIKRRCLYFWVDYPDAVRELEIVRRKAPEASEDLSRQVVAFVQKLRRGDLFKAPGIAETLDWTRALTTLDALSLDPQVVDDTLGALLKYQDDLARVQGATTATLIAEIRAEAGT
jgi:MoxR-like ATPase